MVDNLIKAHKNYDLKAPSKTLKAYYDTFSELLLPPATDGDDDSESEEELQSMIKTHRPWAPLHHTTGHHHRLQLQLHCADVDTSLLRASLGGRYCHSWDLHAKVASLRYLLNRGTTSKLIDEENTSATGKATGSTTASSSKKKGVRSTTITAGYDMKITIKHVKRV